MNSEPGQLGSKTENYAHYVTNKESLPSWEEVPLEYLIGLAKLSVGVTGGVGTHLVIEYFEDAFDGDKLNLLKAFESKDKDVIIEAVSSAIRKQDLKNSMKGNLGGNIQSYVGYIMDALEGEFEKKTE